MTFLLESAVVHDFAFRAPPPPRCVSSSIPSKGGGLGKSSSLSLHSEPLFIALPTPRGALPRASFSTSARPAEDTAISAPTTPMSMTPPSRSPSPFVRSLDLINFVLPDECLLLVFSHIESQADLNSASLVCKRWLALEGWQRKQIKLKDGRVIPRVQARFPNLASLDLSDSAVGDSGLAAVGAGCLRLRTLNLSMCQGITDSGVAAMAQGCSRLREVNLAMCQGLTNRGLTALAGACPLLSCLDLTMCQGIDDEGVACIAAKCLNLESLCLYRCSGVHDSSLEALGRNCVGLTALNLTECQGITDSGLAALSQGCSAMQTLYLNACAKLTNQGLQSLGEGCPALRRLDLRFCTGVSDHGLGFLRQGCRQLTSLDLRFCFRVAQLGMRQGSTVVGGWPALQTLVLVACRQVDNTTLALLGSLSGRTLQSLDLTMCQGITDCGLSALAASCRSLTSLNIGGCGGVSDQGLAAIANVAALESLVLYECRQVTEAGLHFLAEGRCRLRTLDLTMCMKVGDAGVAALAEGSGRSLQKLLLSGCSRLGLPAFEAIGQHCSDLTVLDLSACEGVREGALAAICGGCPQLRSLDLTMCQGVSDASLRVIADSCPHMEHLNLSMCPAVTDQGLECLKRAGLTGLEGVNLTGCTGLSKGSVQEKQGRKTMHHKAWMRRGVV